MTKTTIIGRKAEISRLKAIISSDKAEFIAIYGRRRVGKTFLVRNCCANLGLFFEIVGLKDGAMRYQLENFAQALAATFFDNLEIKPPNRWQIAFERLTQELEKVSKNKKIILFFDELPWLAKKRSGFMQSLDYIWNKHWSKNPQIKLIVCGSAASWMIDNLINAKGGLYNRVTNIMLLKPFTLQETAYYLRQKGINYPTRQLIETYMVLGGIPHYLNQVQKSKSSAQNINSICFKEDGVLFLEFDRIFASLFNCHEQNREIVLEISKHQYGISRDELLKRVKMRSGGSFNKRIAELKSSGFIQVFVPYGQNSKNQFFKVTDEYTLFYLRWIEPIKDRVDLLVKNYWHTKINTPEWYSWAGYTFENICYKHFSDIMHVLELDNIACEIGVCRFVANKSSDNGAQIDLLIDRSDGIIMVGEIKFTKEPFMIDKEYAIKLKNKLEIFMRNFKTRKKIQLLLITSCGLKANMWSDDLVDVSVNFEDII